MGRVGPGYLAIFPTIMWKQGKGIHNSVWKHQQTMRERSINWSPSGDGPINHSAFVWRHVVQPEKSCFQRIFMLREKTKRKYSVDSSNLWVIGPQVIYFYLFLFSSIFPLLFLKIVFFSIYITFQSEKINTTFKISQASKNLKETV